MTKVLQFPSGQELPVEEVTRTMAVDSVTLAPRSSGEGQGVATLPPPPAHLSDLEIPEPGTIRTRSVGGGGEVDGVYGPVCHEQNSPSFAPDIHSDNLIHNHALSMLLNPIHVTLGDEMTDTAPSEIHSDEQLRAPSGQFESEAQKAKREATTERLKREQGWYYLLKCWVKDRSMFIGYAGFAMLIVIAAVLTGVSSALVGMGF